jgi:hypothetical protein
MSTVAHISKFIGIHKSLISHFIPYRGTSLETRIDALEAELQEK